MDGGDDEDGVVLEASKFSTVTHALSSLSILSTSLDKLLGLLGVWASIFTPLLPKLLL